MFCVRDLSITITRGDTGLLTITTESDHVFGEADRAVFTMSRNGTVIKEQVLTPDMDGRVQIEFANAETETWTPGSYSWDIRYVLDAVMDEQGRVTDGREVITPMKPGTLTVIAAVGNV